jgi:serine/threonine-protein kinase
MKRLPPEPAPSEESVARFKQEAKYLSELNHQNIVAAHDFSLVSAPYYIVEELVSGESLRDRLSSRRLSVEDALGFAAQIASGLAAAHKRRVIHRDIKPGNIMIASHGEIKIVDFGLATTTNRDLGTEDSTPTQVTPAGHRACWNPALHEPGAGSRAHAR